MTNLWVIHDLINGNALAKCLTLEEARRLCGDDEVIYRYEVKDCKAVNPVKEAA